MKTYKPTLKAKHICNSHQATHKPKIAKEYAFANADGRPKKNTECTTAGKQNCQYIVLLRLFIGEKVLSWRGELRSLALQIFETAKRYMQLSKPSTLICRGNFDT